MLRNNDAQRRHSGIWRDVPFPEIGYTPKASGKKITIVGVGQRSIATGLALQNVFREKNVVYFNGDVPDKGFNYIPQDEGSVLLRPGAKINTTKDLAMTKNSAVCIFGLEAITGLRKQETGVMQTIQMYAYLIPKVVSLSPKATVIVLSDPVPLWTSVSASGIQLVDVNPDVLRPIKDKNNWSEVNNLLKQVNGELKRRSPMALKLYGEEVARLTEAVLWNTGGTFPVSTYAMNIHCINFILPREDD